MAGFEVIIYGRFWVITEDDRSVCRKVQRLKRAFGSSSAETLEFNQLSWREHPIPP
jgi:hypothetical protein